MKHQNADLSASIDVEINGCLAITTYALTYTNTSNVVEEAIYHFTLPRMGAMTGCKVQVDGCHFEGAIQTRDKANTTYEEALADGKRTVLIESLDDGVYAINAGNISPDQNIVITLEIASAITVVSGIDEYTYRLPTNIAPRYRGTNNDIEPTYEWFARYPFTATIRSSKSLETTASSHKLHLVNGTLLFQGELDSDIFLSWQSDEVGLLYEGSYAGHTYTLGYPKPPNNNEQKQVSSAVQIFLDRSGSMDGASITLARQALSTVVSRLDNQTFLNLVSFGSEFESLYALPMLLDDTIRKRTRQYLSLVEADMGGTELDIALIQSLKDFTDDEHQNHALIVTDGHVHVDKESIAAITLLCQQKRIHLHVVGVGYGVNEHMLSQLDTCSDGVLYVANPHQDLTITLNEIGNLINSGAQKTEMQWVEQSNWDCLSQTHYEGFSQLAISDTSNSLQVQDDLILTPSELTGKWAQALVCVAAMRHIIHLESTAAKVMAESLELLTQHTSLVMVDTSGKRVEAPAQTIVIAQMDSCKAFKMTDFSAGLIDSQCIDIPIFLRKTKNTETTHDSPEASLLEELQGGAWRKVRWSRRYLLKAGLSAPLLDALTDIANKYGFTLVDAVLLHLQTYADRELILSPPKVKRRLQKTISGYSHGFITEVQSYGDLYEV